MNIAKILLPALCGAFLAAPVWAQPAEPAVPAAHELTATDVESWLDGYMPYALTRGDVAGAVVVVVKDGKVLFEKGYGYSDVKAKTPVDPQKTAFRPGSISKLFTWTSVMQLVEQGKLDLDRDVNAYLDFKIPDDGWGKPVTLRNIMTHTGGFEEASKALITSNVANTGLERVLKLYTPARVYAPGSTPAYSNYATAVAGYIVQRVSGEDFDSYIENHIFKPLGMATSSFRQPLPENVAAAMSKGYMRGSGEAQPYEYVSLAPAGSLATTGDDMAKFMIAHLQNGTYGDAQILKPETAHMMHDTPNEILPNIHRMLLGFYEQDKNGHRIISHGGDTVLFHSEFNLFVNDNVGIFFSGNSQGREGGVGAVRSALLDEFADRYFPGPAPTGEVDAATAKKHAEMIVGHYDVSRRFHTNFLAAARLLGQMHVIANPDNTITLVGMNDLNGAPRKWKEIQPFLWRDVDGKTRLSAKSENGEVTRFGMDGLPFMVWDRTSFAVSTAWLQPALIASLAALALTVVLWPVAAVVRRNYRAPFGLYGSEAMAYRAVRIFALLSLLVWVGWFLLLSSAFGYNGNPANYLDTRLTILQIAGWVAFVGAVVISGWNALVTLQSDRGVIAKLWSIVLVLATLCVFWAAFANKLLAITTDY